MSPKLAVPKIDVNAPLKVEKTPSPDHSEEEKKGKRLYFIGIGVFVALIIATIGVFTLMPLIIKKAEDLVVKPVASEEEAPAIEEKKIAPSEWTFDVLNGSGVAGAAKGAADKLKARGYQVDKVGNYEGTAQNSLIFIAKDFTSQKDLLLEDLKADFPGISYEGELTDSSASARLIIGKE